jgi:hypothetical protein
MKFQGRVNTMFLLAGAMLSFAGDLELPEDLERVSILETTEERLWIWDLPMDTVWVINRTGDVLQRYDKRGYGPGEFIRISGIRVFGDSVYICDWARRVVMQFDFDLKLIRERRFPGMVRDIWVDPAEPDLWRVYAWDPVIKHSVHTYDVSTAGPPERMFSFGDGLGDDRLAGMEYGDILSWGSKPLHHHAYLPYIEIYDSRGVQEKRVNIPGLEGPQMHRDILMGVSSSEHARREFSRGFVRDDVYVFLMRDYTAEERWMYRLNLTEGNVMRIPAPKNLVVAASGETFIGQRDNTTGKHRALSPLPLYFPQLPTTAGVASASLKP